jgi:caa(3)-type oxidase subunit IV
MDPEAVDVEYDMEDEGSRAHPDPHRPHPSVREYVRIGVVLAVLTALEVAISYTLEGAVQIAMLHVFSITKLLLVVLWFMHLKFDDRRYARFFVTGSVGAFTLYIIVLLTFQVFGV